MLILRPMKGGHTMPITAVEPPVRTRTRDSRFSDDDLKAALEILSNGKSAACIAVPVKEQKARTTKVVKGKDGKERGGNKLSAEDVALNMARSAAHTLNRAMKAKHNREFAASAWLDDKGNAIGALLPREPNKRAQDTTNGAQPATPAA